MRYRLVISTFFFVFLNVHSATAQISTDVTIPNQKTIRLKINSTKPLPREFTHGSALQVDAYRLYEVETPDPDKPCVYERCIRVWDGFLDPNNKPSCIGDCQEITLNLTRNLPAQGSFLLVVRDLEAVGKPGKVGFKVNPVAEIIGPWDAYQKRSEFRVKSNVLITPATSVTVTRTVNRLTSDSLNVVEVPKDVDASLLPLNTTPSPKFIHSFRFKKKLMEGNEYDFVISNGLVDAANQTVVAKGKLKIPGSAAPLDDPKISLTLNSLSAASQKSVLDFVLSYKPLRNVKTFKVRKKQFYFEPEINSDIGLRSTKSNNSTTFYLPFTANFELEKPYRCQPDPEHPGNCDAFNSSNIPAFASWSRTPWLRFAATKFYLGPKLEFDRSFHRVNTLGSARLDFRLFRWLGSVSHKRGLISGDIGEEKTATLEGINTGLRIIPYISFDFGGHANNETIEKELSATQTVTLVVPRHKILRGYLGFTGTIEWRLGPVPMTITLDESTVYLGSREIIGFPTDTGVEQRELRGFHPHFKTVWDIAFDTVKHYSFSVTFENGRLAPNFEYLNKLSAGFKVQY